MSNTSERVEHPSEGFDHTKPKNEVDVVAGWAKQFEAGDTIRWTSDAVDEVQESEIIGFSTSTTLAEPVIEVPDVLDEDAENESVRVPQDAWVPEDSQSVAHIEMEYTQTMTAKIPVEEMPADESDAFHLVKNTDPDFVTDVLPNRWDDAVSVGELDVVGIEEEEVGER
jgi:hypothetical protein